jgi:hypothetical protein
VGYPEQTRACEVRIEAQQTYVLCKLCARARARHYHLLFTSESRWGDSLKVTRVALLQDFAEQLMSPDLSAYKDGKQVLYIAKLMLVKMAHKDWTPIDRQWITTQAKRLRKAMPAACHFGSEGTIVGSTIPTVERLNLGNGSIEADSTELHFGFTLPAATAETLEKTWHACKAPPLEGRGMELMDLKRVGEDDSSEDEEHMSEADSNPRPVRLQMTVKLDDCSRRLGVLHEAPSEDGGLPVVTVNAGSVEEDLQWLKTSLARMLCLQRPDKDPEEFRCFALACRACRLICC